MGCYLHCQRVITLCAGSSILFLSHAAINSSFILAEYCSHSPLMPLQPSLHDNRLLKHKAREIWYVSCVLIHMLLPEPSFAPRFSLAHTHTLPTGTHTHRKHTQKIIEAEAVILLSSCFQGHPTIISPSWPQYVCYTSHLSISGGLVSLNPSHFCHHSSSARMNDELIASSSVYYILIKKQLLFFFFFLFFSFFSYSILKNSIRLHNTLNMYMPFSTIYLHVCNIC